MRKKHNNFSGGFIQSFSHLIETEGNNDFLGVLRKVSQLMHIKEETHYTQILSKNIQSMAAEIEMKLDDFLDQKEIPFRTEVFLLILFQELFDKFVLQ